MIVAAISIHALWLVQWSSTSTRDVGDGVDEREELRDVVAIGPRQDDGDRRTIGICREVMLGTWSCAICRVRSCF